MTKEIKKLLCLDPERERVKKLYREVFGPYGDADRWIDEHPSDAEEILKILQSTK